jgi:hypothetical protein
MRGICFKEQLFDLTVKGLKTVTRRMKDIYNVGETLYLKEPYFINADGSIDYKFDNKVKHEKWKNKLFMPERYARYFIQIIDKRQEKLQEITEEECFLEGIQNEIVAGNFNEDIWFHYFNGIDLICYGNPIDAFAALIDKINGKGTWGSNPIVTRYKFKFIKLLRKKEIKLIET